MDSKRHADPTLTSEDESEVYCSDRSTGSVPTGYGLNSSCDSEERYSNSHPPQKATKYPIKNQAFPVLDSSSKLEKLHMQRLWELREMKTAAMVLVTPAEILMRSDSNFPGRLDGTIAGGPPAPIFTPSDGICDSENSEG